MSEDKFWNDELVKEFIEFEGTGIKSIQMQIDEFKQSKTKHKDYLFTTEDGVKVFEGDRFWYIDNRMTPFECLSAPQGSIFVCTFSTKEKADEYILLNQKLLSVNDICEWYKQYYYVGMPELQSAFIESIKRIAKGKM